MNNKKHLVIFVAIVAIIFIILFRLFAIIENRGKVLVTFVTAPKNAQIYIDDDKVQHKTHLKPGNYKIKVTSDNFNPYSNTLTINSNKKSIKVPVVLSNINTLSEEDVRNYETAVHKAQAIGASIAQNEGIAQRKENPIIDLLPIINDYYRIDYSYADEQQTKLILEIRADTATGRYLALQKIFGMGYNPSNYNVSFIGFVSPFDELETPL